EIGARRFLRQIRADHLDAALILRADLMRELLELVFRARDQDQRRSLLRERVREGFADAGRRAGDQRGLVGRRAHPRMKPTTRSSSPRSRNTMVILPVSPREASIFTDVPRRADSSFSSLPNGRGSARSGGSFGAFSACTSASVARTESPRSMTSFASEMRRGPCTPSSALAWPNVILFSRT